MVATETRMLWWSARCQAMVSGPASRPAVVSLSRSCMISVTVAGRIAVGLVWGGVSEAGTRPRLGAVAGDQAANPAWLTP
jgi:hypothetical protein